MCLHPRSQQGAAAAEDDAHTYVNQGEVGLSRLEDIDLSPSTRARAAGEQAEGAAGADDGNDFVQRRLSVHDVFDDQWDEEEAAAEEEEAPVEPVG